MVDFTKLKKTSGNFDKLAKAIEQLNKTDSSKDDKFYKIDVDKAGNGYVVFRFLPAPAVDGDDALPWVKVWDHGFQGPGGWYIENSLTTLGQKDPVSEYNSQLWNSGIEANKEIVRAQKRRLSYFSNIFVIKDPSHPENEGKAFKFKYGKKIWDKIELAMNPEFEDESPLNPFDFWTGANFKLKIRKVEGYRNYDKSEFEDPSALLDDDDALEVIWKQEYSLKEFLDPKNFKSYDELKARLDKVLGLDGAASTPKSSAESSKPVQSKKMAAKDVIESVDNSVDTDDDLAYFSKLAED